MEQFLITRTTPSIFLHQEAMIGVMWASLCYLCEKLQSLQNTVFFPLHNLGTWAEFRGRKLSFLDMTTEADYTLLPVAIHTMCLPCICLHGSFLWPMQANCELGLCHSWVCSGISIWMLYMVSGLLGFAYVLNALPVAESICRIFFWVTVEHWLHSFQQDDPQAIHIAKVTWLIWILINTMIKLGFMTLSGMKFDSSFQQIT